MANTSSAKKMSRKIISRNHINTSRRSRMKTFINRVLNAVQSGDKNKAKIEFNLAESEIQKCVNKGVIKKNKSSNSISRLSSKVKNM